MPGKFCKPAKNVKFNCIFFKSRIPSLKMGANNAR